MTSYAVIIRYQSYPGRADRGAPTRAVWGAPHFATEGQAAFERFGAVRSLRDQFLARLHDANQTARSLFESLLMSPIAVFHAWNLAKELTHGVQKNSVNGAQKYE